MGKLIYSALASADGYVEDAGGNFDWAAPDEEVHYFVNEVSPHISVITLRSGSGADDGRPATGWTTESAADWAGPACSPAPGLVGICGWDPATFTERIVSSLVAELVQG